jgi:hypothetical protein
LKKNQELQNISFYNSQKVLTSQNESNNQSLNEHLITSSRFSNPFVNPHNGLAMEPQISVKFGSNIQSANPYDVKRESREFNMVE